MALTREKNSDTNNSTIPQEYTFVSPMSGKFTGKNHSNMPIATDWKAVLILPRALADIVKPCWLAIPLKPVMVISLQSSRATTQAETLSKGISMINAVVTISLSANGSINAPREDCLSSARGP